VTRLKEEKIQNLRKKVGEMRKDRQGIEELALPQHEHPYDDHREGYNQAISDVLRLLVNVRD
jgi:hypothetical protein